MSALEPAAPARVEDYALSVLLHDIGKFWERCSDAARPSPAELQLFCPRLPDSGAFAHAHAALSARFIEETVGIPGAARWGPKHHLPDDRSREEVCAQIADLLATGETSPDASRDAPAAAETPLQTVLGHLATLEGGSVPRSLPLVRLDHHQESLFPRAAAAISREEYRFAWNHFLHAVDRCGTPLRDLETWRGLLEIFTARIPAASTSRQMKTSPDVDLFSHSLLVSALAVALHRGPLGQADLLSLRSRVLASRVEGDGPPLMTLWRGRISRPPGIALPEDALGKGRAWETFLPRFLAEAAARRIVERLELAWTSVLSSGVGQFSILAPPGAERAAIEEEIDGLLERETGCLLSFSLRTVDLTLGDLRSGSGGRWLCLDGRLESESVAPEPVLRRLGPPAEPVDTERRRQAFFAGVEELDGLLAGASLLVRRRPRAEEPEGFRRLLAALGSIVEPAVPAALGSEPSGVEAIYTLDKLDLEEFARLRAGRPLAAGFRPSCACGLDPVTAGGGGPQAYLRAGVKGLPQLLRSGRIASGGALARALILEEELRRFFAIWGRAQAEARRLQSAVVLRAGGEEFVARGGPRAVLELAEALRGGLEALLPGRRELDLGAWIEFCGRELSLEEMQRLREEAPRLAARARSRPGALRRLERLIEAEGASERRLDPVLVELASLIAKEPR